MIKKYLSTIIEFKLFISQKTQSTTKFRELKKVTFPPFITEMFFFNSSDSLYYVNKYFTSFIVIDNINIWDVSQRDFDE